VAYYDAYNAGDIDAVAALLAPDVSYHDMIYEVRCAAGAVR
jgi:ketosteroid isomerase-like protein